MHLQVWSIAETGRFRPSGRAFSAVSGVYIADRSGPTPEEPATSSSSCAMIRVTSNMLFQIFVSTTRHAYNLFGGADFYRGNGPVAGGRCLQGQLQSTFPKSRAFRDARERGFLWDSEYPMIRWLEANGYDVSYAAGFIRSGGSFRSHATQDLFVGRPRRILVEHTTCERRGGARRRNFSGIFQRESMFWKTRWENSIAGDSTPYRTEVCYKETWDNAKSDPSTEWTGTWRDPRFSPPSDGGRPENALVGTLFHG